MAYGLMVPAVAITLFIALLLVRRQLHRALAPERVVGTASPASVGLAFSEIRFPTCNGKTLAGWFVPASGPGPHPAVAVVHGWGGNAETMLPLAAPLHAAGFAVLLFEARCHGRSDEDSFASLPRFAEDCASAVDWLRVHAGLGSGDTAGIGLVGHSVGAGAVLLAAARDPGIAAVVSIAAFTHPEAMMRRWFAFRGIPQRPLGSLILRYVERVIGHRFDDIAPIATIRRLHCPVLLVHGAEDATVPVEEAHAIHAAGGPNVQLKIVAGSHDDYADLERELPALVDFLRAAVR